MSASNDSSFLRMFMFILGGLVAFTVIVMVAAGLIGGDLAEKVRDSTERDLITQRIAPIGKVRVAPKPAAPEAAPPAQPAADAAAPAPAPALAAAPVPAEPAVAPALAAVGAAASELAGKAGAMVSSATGSVSSAVSGAAAKVADVIAPARPVDLAKGKQVYDSACFVCHAAAVAGAPKLGDKAAWAPRIAKGDEVLIKHAIGGFVGMPPKGGRQDLSDGDVTAAVGYMVDAAR